MFDEHTKFDWWSQSEIWHEMSMNIRYMYIAYNIDNNHSTLKQHADKYKFLIHELKSFLQYIYAAADLLV